MKKLSLTLFFLTLSLGAITADELVKNGDFSQGSTSWRGVQIDDAPENPLAAAPTTAGMPVKLDETHWVKVYQEIVGKGTDLNLKVDLKLSKDTVFSTKDEDYANVSHAIGYDGWKAFKAPVQSCFFMISDFGPNKGHFITPVPKFGTDEVQTFTVTFPNKDQERKTLTLAFPPGTGTVTLLKVSVQD